MTQILELYHKLRGGNICLIRHEIFPAHHCYQKRHTDRLVQSMALRKVVDNDGFITYFQGKNYAHLL